MILGSSQILSLNLVGGKLVHPRALVTTNPGSLKPILQVLVTFQRGEWVQAPKELTLLVLEDVSRANSTSRYSTRRLEVLSAPRWIYRLPPLRPTSSTWIQQAQNSLASWLAGWLVGSGVIMLQDLGGT